MLSFLPGPLRGLFAALGIGLNTVLVALPLFALVVLKLLIPIRAWRELSTRVLVGLATGWVSVNSAMFELLHRIEWQLSGLEDLSPREWYLVASNHLSIVDIPVVQKVLNRRIPFLKFFLKQELIWVPVLGLAWWALDFPFMKRYSRAQVRANPELGGVDLERTRRACERFRAAPVAVFNFLEGTRFTEAKRERQQSPYAHLLKPRAGGAAFVVGALGDRVRTMVDLTLFYPQGRPGLWDLMAGRVGRIVVDVRVLPIPAQFLGRDYAGDPEFRDAFQAWIRELWRAKDERIGELLAAARG